MPLFPQSCVIFSLVQALFSLCSRLFLAADVSFLVILVQFFCDLRVILSVTFKVHSVMLLIVLW